jgi:hypothetical protein
MGGDCLNYGCVPSKALIKSAKLAHQMRHGAKYGLSDTTPSFSFKAVMQRVHHVIRAIEPLEGVGRMLDYRPVTRVRDLTNGPAKLVYALGLKPAQIAASAPEGGVTRVATLSLTDGGAPAVRIALSRSRRVCALASARKAIAATPTAATARTAFSVRIDQSPYPGCLA